MKRILIPATVNKLDKEKHKFVSTHESTLNILSSDGGGVCQTLTCSTCGGEMNRHGSTMVIEEVMNEDVTCRIIGQVEDKKVLDGIDAIDVYSKKVIRNGVCGCLTTNSNTSFTHCGTFLVPEREGFKVIKNYRIRKLTPLECFRLMAVSDEDARKMMAVNSNSKCYQQAGDSIVVDVMCAMFRKLNIKGVKQNG